MVKYYIGEEKKVTSYRHETFVIKNGDKLHIEQSYGNKVSCNHENGSGVMLYNNEIGTDKELRDKNIKYSEQYY